MEQGPHFTSNQFDELMNEIKKLHQLNGTMRATIDQQGKMIKTMHDARLKERLKSFVRPKIGVLFQYEPKKLVIPKHYHHRPALNHPPLISIVTPSYNQADYLEKTMLSVLNQGYPSLEYIVQDGGSSDGSVDLIKKHVHALKHWESKKDNGQSEAINLGFRHATGEIMAYLNSDDLLIEGTLHYVADYFSKHPEVDVVYGHRIIIDEADYEVGRWILPKHDDKVLSWADFVPQETLFWRRSIWDKAGAQIDENFKFAMDWDLLLRFRDAGAKMVRLPRFLGAFRIHPYQKTSSNMSSVGMQEMEILKHRCHGRPITQAEINHHLKSYKIQHVLLQKLYRAKLLRY